MAISNKSGSIDDETIILLAALGVAVYALWPLISGINKLGTGVKTAICQLNTAIDQAGCAALQSAAQSYVNLTSCAAAVAAGSILLPNGAAIPSSAITMTCMSTNAFTYQGQTFYLTGVSTQGGYVASYTPN
jgi:hypothetical protein